MKKLLLPLLLLAVLLLFGCGKTNDAKTPDEYVQRIRKFTLKGIGDKITQDVLILGAREDHFIMPRLFHEEYDLLTNVRSLTLSLFTDRQDAGAHCNVGNTKLALDTMADWITRAKAVV